MKQQHEHPMTTPTAVYIDALRALAVMEKEVQAGFEADFLASNLDRVQQYGDQTWFSAPQQACIRQLVEKYFSPARAAEILGQQRLL